MAKKPTKNVAKKEPTKPKVLICTPMYGGMCTGSYTLSMLQMQAALGLTQQQQDQVFPVLYGQALGQMSGEPADAPPAASDPKSR